MSAIGVETDIARPRRDFRNDPTRRSPGFNARRFRGLARECELTEINMIDAVTTIPREILMRIPALAILITVTVLTPAPTLAQTYSSDYPVCMQAYRWGGSDIECSYASLAQCAMSASGLSAQCTINPYFAGSQARRESRRHRRIY